MVRLLQASYFIVQYPKLNNTLKFISYYLRKTYSTGNRFYFDSIIKSNKYEKIY